MREIKFRVWNVKDKEWEIGLRYGLHFDPITGSFFTDEGPSDEPWTEGVPEGELITEQFTGLHDKNGNEIYEGDIVRHRYTPEEVSPSYSEMVVEWLNHRAGWNLIDDISFYEVIGNIHDNSEMISK